MIENILIKEMEHSYLDMKMTIAFDLDKNELSIKYSGSQGNVEDREKYKIDIIKQLLVENSNITCEKDCKNCEYNNIRTKTTYGTYWTGTDRAMSSVKKTIVECLKHKKYIEESGINTNDQIDLY